MRDHQQRIRSAVTVSPRWRRRVTAIAIACTVAIASHGARAETFSAKLTHRGLVTDAGDGTTSALVRQGWLQHRDGPTFAYRTGGQTVAGVWTDGGAAAVVRSGTSVAAPVIGRVIPSWDDGALRLSIQPAGGAAIRTDVFRQPDRGPTLARDILTRAELEGTYRAILRTDGGRKDGWLTVHIDPEGATRFEGDLPATIPPALAAAAAVNDEIGTIYENVADVGPLRR